MISIKKMKSLARRNLEEYGTNEHVFGLGMETEEKNPTILPSAKALGKLQISEPSLNEFMQKQAGLIYDETKALRGSRTISPETFNLECGPLVDYE